MAKIVDGYTDEKNVYAQIIGEHNISMYGSGDYVLSVGECLGYDLVSNNEIRIKDGLFITQGRRGYIEKGTSDTCIIENGAHNVNRNDLIIIEYEKNEATLVESHTTKVIKGTPAEVAADPELVTGDIQNGAVLHQMPLYRVKIEGLNIVAVEQMFAFGSVAAETVDPMLATKKGFAADALAVKNQFDEQNKKIDKVNVYVGEDGMIHFTDSEGADSVLPFSADFSDKIIAAAYAWYVHGTGGGCQLDTTVPGTINAYDYFSVAQGSITVKAGATALVVINNHPDNPGKLSVFNKTHDVNTEYRCVNTNQNDNFVIAVAYEK